MANGSWSNSCNAYEGVPTHEPQVTVTEEAPNIAWACSRLLHRFVGIRGDESEEGGWKEKSERWVVRHS